MGRYLRDQTKLLGAQDSFIAALNMELAVYIPGVGLERICRDMQLPRDLGSREVGCQQPEYVQLPVAERRQQWLRCAACGGSVCRKGEQGKQICGVSGLDVMQDGFF